MSVQLRGHHLLCMLTFVGEGYTVAFTDNYRKIAKRLSAGETIEIVEGPDDICQPLLCSEGAHCHKASVVQRDIAALDAVGRLLGKTLVVGDTLEPDHVFLSRLRLAFSHNSIRKACHDCEWSSLCDKVAASGFKGVKITSETAEAAGCHG
ncbi:DUF1284 domain-containing protein [Agrobacterium sp.]|uniref:DUF1284 domain-containing protein n=1 Tax=Agrobacterium sp. TaxID=361 RepID=UPI0028AAAB11|nr:DUF1284 domain-containing protein [Agrobacterium sp.]